ncbi:acyltransferase [Pedobacter sp. Leaf250]|uniref:acyltransferase family protein n=1 Tax=Pedobacter sp. Leaf250 TaxID=2876559 RepID=UPI001E58BAAD|nr:acyltransferase [Pedobacter sp. Leaf250]
MKEQIKHRFLVLDMFRGIFASLVVFYHMSAFSNTPVLNNDFIKNADMFVDFFFVLSGFVICYSYQEINSSTALKSFLFKRIARIYPLHLFMLLLFLAVEGIKFVLVNHVKINNSLDNSITTFFSSLFLINSVKLPNVRDIGWNMVSWSISAELISYVVFGIVCLFIKVKMGIKPTIYLIVALLSALLIYLITGKSKLDYTYDYGFLRGLTGFFIGAFCLYCFKYLHSRYLNLNRSLFNVLEITVLLLIAISIALGDYLKLIGFIYELVFFVSILVFSFEMGWISKVFSRIEIFQKLGKYSYSIYMVHTLFISIFNVIFIRIFKLPETSYWYLFALNFIVIYYAAQWTYKNIEMRFQYRSKKVK